MKTIIGIQISCKIPSKPPDILPHKKSIPVLGKQSLDVKVMESAHLNNTDEFETNTHKVSSEREADVVGDIFTGMHPYSQPFVYRSLLGKQLDVFIAYDMDEGVTELKWFQGEGVIIVSNGSIIVKPGEKSAYF